MFVFYSTRYNPEQYPEVYTFKGYYLDVDAQAALLVEASQMHGPSACVWMVPNTE